MNVTPEIMAKIGREDFGPTQLEAELHRQAANEAHAGDARRAESSRLQFVDVASDEVARVIRLLLL